MSTLARQASVLLVGGLLTVILVMRLARRRLLTTRYAIGWLGVGLFITSAALLLPFVGRLGEFADITPTAVLLMLSSITLLAITVQLSISVSLLQERLRTTAEANALLAHRVEELERRHDEH
jgi:hypothetical protein